MGRPGRALSFMASRIQFTKFQCFGNDYIVCEARHTVHVASLNEFARRICDRHYGAGADGVALIGEPQAASADFAVRIFNPDGGEAGLSGNGTRAAAAYLYYMDLWTSADLRLETLAGIKLYRLRELVAKGHYWFDAEMGVPRFDTASIPMTVPEPLETARSYPLIVENESFSVTVLQIGNPHCAIFVDDFDALDWRRVGRAIESHPQFPERINVEFVRVRDRANLDLRIWERGAGETLSSGTCSCAAAIAAIVNGRADRRVNVWTPGGKIPVEWRDDNQVVMTGRADIVYCGEWLD